MSDCTVPPSLAGQIKRFAGLSALPDCRAQVAIECVPVAPTSPPITYTLASRAIQVLGEGKGGGVQWERVGDLLVEHIRNKH